MACLLSEKTQNNCPVLLGSHGIQDGLAVLVSQLMCMQQETHRLLGNQSSDWPQASESFCVML